MSSISTYIFEKNDSITIDDCKKIIALFNGDIRREPGKTSQGIVSKKVSSDLCIPAAGDWAALSTVIDEAIEQAIGQFMLKHKSFELLREAGNICITKPQLQHYKKNEGYFDWHIDSYPDDNRILAVIIYLNDVTEGGETLFHDGSEVIPEGGKLVAFPPYWNYMHKGNTPLSEDKYIITCFAELSM